MARIMAASLQGCGVKPRQFDRLRREFVPVRSLTGLAAVCLLSLAGCASGPAPAGMSEAERPESTRVAELQIVDCLLPGMVRRLGNTEYLTPRRPVKTTAADCQIRGGEYTSYDRADYKTALAVWMPAAQAGDAEAQTNVGEIYERGLGGEPNYQAAFIWYERAAKQGDTRAQFNLGTLYEQGLGVEKDRVAALNWYRKAWDIPEDSVIFQSAAAAETEELRRQLNQLVEERDARIRKLERDLNELQSKASTQSNDGGQATSELELEIRDLKSWIASLESEKQDSVTQLASLPKLRQPTPTTKYETMPGPEQSLKRGDVDFGRYYALIIGNQRYANLESLDTPENDAAEMAELLREKYGFSVEMLLNADNIRVMETINDLNEKLGENDNLLIYYAGHGARVEAGDIESGYWLPVNADAPPRDTYWVSNEFITGHLGRISAKRVMVVADSCYAGLLSDAPSYLMLKGAPEYTDEFLRYKLPKRSRLLLASGGDRPVLDNGAPGHSVFASVLLETLRDNNTVLSGPQLFAEIDEEVRRRSAASGFGQEAEYKIIKGAGHEVGDFFFVPVTGS